VTELHTPAAPEATGTEEPAIVVGYDGSAGAELALQWALQEARLLHVGVTVVQSWHEPTISKRTWVERWKDPAFEERSATEALRRTVDVAGAPYPDVPRQSTIVDDRPVDALLAAADGHQLVVVGSRGHGGFIGLALGSVAEHVADASPVPVAVVRAEGAVDGDIVVGIDGSVGSRRALLWAAAEGRARSRPVRAVLAWTAGLPIATHGAQPFGAAATETDARMALHHIVTEELGSARADEVECVALCEPAAKTLVDAAAGAALVVLGASANVRDGHRHHLGSVGRQVLRHAPAPVVITR
jgi:nucleotide-binding universal stress UspA family protein